MNRLIYNVAGLHWEIDIGFHLTDLGITITKHHTTTTILIKNNSYSSIKSILEQLCDSDTVMKILNILYKRIKTIILGDSKCRLYVVNNKTKIHFAYYNSFCRYYHCDTNNRKTIENLPKKMSTYFPQEKVNEIMKYLSIYTTRSAPSLISLSCRKIKEKKIDFWLYNEIKSNKIY